MEFVIGAILLLIGLFITGFFIRKNYYREIDQLESWKIQIMNRPVLEEMSKVKKLNMVGQTEEMFERWRRTWDEIVTVQLPDVEELLFDAEEFVDKFRFQKGKAVLQKIEQILKESEQKIEQLMMEINELVGSEELSRASKEEIERSLREAKKQLLAHRHTFGVAIQYLEKTVEEIATELKAFDELTENGNYIEARELVEKLAQEMNRLQHYIETVPALLTECLSVLPSSIEELEEGYAEMEQQGYRLEHLQIQDDLKEMKEEIQSFICQLEEGAIETVAEGVQQIKDKINTIYDLLEKEVLAKQYIVQHEGKSKHLLMELLKSNEALKHETEMVRMSYQLDEKELNIPKRIDQSLKQLSKRLDMLSVKINGNETSYSLLQEELEDIRAQLEELQKEQQLFNEQMQNLRKDELEAREQIKELKKKISESIRLVKKSNVPGLPQEYQLVLEQAQSSIQEVLESLEEKPLNMNNVNYRLKEAQADVEYLREKTEEMVEQVILAEKIIQYGNRYRSRYEHVRQGLQEAEVAFRTYNYRGACEQAASIVEEIDPGALKRIEEWVNEELIHWKEDY
jgi:septation ring formation regulator